MLDFFLLSADNRSDKVMYPTLVHCLQKHLHTITGNDQTYSQLSLLLSKLFALAEVIVEKLFCKHIDGAVEDYLRQPFSSL